MPSRARALRRGGGGAGAHGASRACVSGMPKRTISRASISASSPGLGGITAHANAAGDELSILVGGHLLHAAVRNVDLDRAGLVAALDARAELVALVV